MRELSQIRGFGPKRLEALDRRGVHTAQDLLERLAVMAGCEGYHMLNSADMDYEDKSAELIRAFIKKKMA